MLKMTYNQILEYFENNQQNQLKEKINLLHPADSAQIINELPSEYQFTAFSLLNDENASDVLPDLYDDLREDILEKMQQNRLVKIIDEMETDEAADIIGELEDDVSKELLEKIDKEDSEDIKQLLKYDEESAGGLMQTEIIAVNRDMKRDEIIEYIREQYEEVENIHYIFVKDDDNKLIGLLEVTRLLLAKSQKKADRALAYSCVAWAASLLAWAASLMTCLASFSAWTISSSIFKYESNIGLYSLIFVIAACVPIPANDTIAVLYALAAAVTASNFPPCS